MGMFDSIEFEDISVLPKVKGIKELKPTGWQTKDLDSTMATYVVRDDKTLVKKIYKQVKASEKEHAEEVARIKKDCESLKKQMPSLYKMWIGQAKYKTVLDRLQKIDHHGIITVYDFYKVKNKKDVWVEYNLKFTDGKLVHVKIIPRR